MKKFLDGQEVDMTPEEITEWQALHAITGFPKTKIYRSTIWRRCTDAEFAAIRTVLSAAPERLQAVFNDSNYLDVNDPLYGMIVESAAQAVGAERAAELLEPEE